MLIGNIKRKDKISFSTISVEIIPPIKDGYIVSILPIEEALKREPNLLAKNSSICANANKAITDINDDDFFLIRLEVTGEQIIIASSWIQEDSITKSQGIKTLTLIISDIKADDVHYYGSLIKSKGHSYVAKVN